MLGLIRLGQVTMVCFALNISYLIKIENLCGFWEDAYKRALQALAAEISPQVYVGTSTECAHAPTQEQGLTFA